MGVAETIQQGFNNISNQLLQVGMAKAKLQQSREEFGLKKKATEAQIKLAKKKGMKMDKEMELYEAKANMIERIFDFKDKSYDVAADKMRGEKQDLNTFATGMGAGLQVDRAEIMEDVTGIPFKEPTRTESFDMDLQKAIARQQAKDTGEQAPAGSISWDALKHKYPTKLNQIKNVMNEFAGVEMQPNFKYGTGGPISRIGSFMSPNQAEIDKTTATVIANIQNEEDLKEFIQDKDLYKAQGVDVKAVEEYFGKKQFKKAQGSAE